MVGSFVLGLLDRLSLLADRRFGWHRLPRPLGLLVLIGMRHRLRRHNLHDTGDPAPVAEALSPPPGDRHLTTRTADGTFNDLANPRMGAAGTRFGRNVPIGHTHPAKDPAILTPNPRLVSRELLTREEFQPATTLNLLAAAWLQFMIRDWFSHGKSPKDRPWELPLPDDDPWPERPMRILRTPPDPTRAPEADALPPTYLNAETHWWDASQLYGSDAAAQARARSGSGGKLREGADAFAEIALESADHPANVPGFWVGLALLQSLFVREHNAICDALHREHPDWSDDDLFDRARLINAALLAKIHTVEWTTGILGHPTMQIGMRANWWGLIGERLHKLIGHPGSGEVLGGIPGSKTNHFGVPYALTEEFVAVYRMHPLIPDELALRAVAGDAPLGERSFAELAGPRGFALLAEFSQADLCYSFGRAHPGAITLHNYPRALQTFERPDGILQDLAATDILRSRELGVPRYNAFRQMMHRPRAKTFADITDNAVWAE